MLSPRQFRVVGTLPVEYPEIVLGIHSRFTRTEYSLMGEFYCDFLVDPKRRRKRRRRLIIQLRFVWCLLCIYQSTFHQALIYVLLSFRFLSFILYSSFSFFRECLDLLGARGHATRWLFYTFASARVTQVRWKLRGENTVRDFEPGRLSGKRVFIVSLTIHRRLRERQRECAVPWGVREVPSRIIRSVFQCDQTRTRP